MVISPIQRATKNAIAHMALISWRWKYEDTVESKADEIRSNIGNVISSLVSVEGEHLAYAFKASLITSDRVGSGKDKIRWPYPIADTNLIAVDEA